MSPAGPVLPQLFFPPQESRCKSTTWFLWCTGSAQRATFASGASSSAVGVEPGQGALPIRCFSRSQQTLICTDQCETLSERIPTTPTLTAQPNLLSAAGSVNAALTNPLNSPIRKGSGGHFSPLCSAAAQNSEFPKSDTDFPSNCLNLLNELVTCSDCCFGLISLGEVQQATPHPAAPGVSLDQNQGRCFWLRKSPSCSCLGERARGIAGLARSRKRPLLISIGERALNQVTPL